MMDDREQIREVYRTNWRCREGLETFMTIAQRETDSGIRTLLFPVSEHYVESRTDETKPEAPKGCFNQCRHHTEDTGIIENTKY